MPRTVLYVITGRDDAWEAFCLDFDLAVQGRSMDEVRASLIKAINMYVATAIKQPEPIRSRLLGRQAPFFVRLMWALRAFWATLAIRAGRHRGMPATIEFVACPA